MRDAPDARARRRDVEGLEIKRLIREGVGGAPDEGGNREISRRDNDCVRDHRHDQKTRRHEVCGRACPAGRRPDRRRDQGRDEKEQDARGRTAHRAHASELGAAPAAQGTLRRVPNGFPPKGVAGLDRERIQRPEVCFGEPKQRAPAEPGDHERRNNDERGADARGLGETAGGFAYPGCQDQWRGAQQHRRQQHLDKPAQQELRDADLG